MQEAVQAETDVKIQLLESELAVSEAAAMA